MIRDFATMLTNLRHRANLTQEALARKADLSLHTIAKLERGGVDPSWSTVRKLARALGVDCRAFDVDNAFTLPPEEPPEAKRRKKK